MKLTFENIGTNTYLVYGIEDADELDTMSLGMLTNNSIPGFAPASFTQMDTKKYIKYNVSSKVSVKQLFSGPVNKKRLLGVFGGVVEAMLSAEDYMLDPSTILLDSDYIFTDVTTSETELVCLPLMGLQQEQNLNMFFKNILFTTQFDQTENCDHVATLINFLNNNPTLVLSDFKAMLNNLAHPVAQPAPAAQRVERPAAAPAAQRVEQPTAAPVQQVRPNPVVQPAMNPLQQPVVKEQTLAAPAVAQQPRQNVAPVNVAVPNIPIAVLAQPKNEKPEKKEKPMSFFYLMQHYNKENAAIYKAQQEAAKANKATPAPVNVAQPKAAQQKAKAVIPNLAIPGQQTPVVAPARPVYNVQPAAAYAESQKQVKQPVPQPAAAQVVQPVQPPMQPAQMAPAGMPLNFGETTVLGGSMGETTVLNGGAAAAKSDPHLIRTKNNEKISLNKPVFRIGKERSYVDYFIGDNTAISRSHANIVNHNGEFFVVDTNSTNHTYVNGGMIHSNEEVKLSHGTKIRLANEDFEFKMY